MAKPFEHEPILLRPCVDALVHQAAGTYMDCTFGRGGHSREILSRLDAQGRLIAVDQDPEAIAVAEQLAATDSRVSVVQSNFEQLASISEQHSNGAGVDGIFMDLGVSSPQLDDAERGFSFMRDGPLDMRMNPASGQSAADFLFQNDAQTIAKVLFEYGEERFARRIAQAIVERNGESKITRTHELAALIDKAVPRRDKHKHPATRSFQAIRIAVNRELDVLPRALSQALEALRPGGRLVVLSFHSLEDRIVKRFFRQHSQAPAVPRGMPVALHTAQLALNLLGKAQKPDSGEIARNPRARSAVLRVAEKAL